MDRASQVLYQHDAQRDRDGPHFTDGQRLHALVGKHEAPQRFRIKMTVGMGHKCPRDAEHARVSGEGPVGKLRQLAVETRWQILTYLANLRFDQMVIVEQPFSGRGDGAAFARNFADGAIAAQQR